MLITSRNRVQNNIPNAMLLGETTCPLSSVTPLRSKPARIIAAYRLRPSLRKAGSYRFVRRI